MIKLVVLDVDGCLTDGSIIYSSDGAELKAFNVKDGLAIKSLQKLGVEVAIITGRSSVALEKRAHELEISYLYQNEKKKLDRLQYIMQKMQIQSSEVAAIGDDMNDLAMLRFCGFSATPSDGASYIKSQVDIVLNSAGGKGAVRELIEHIMEKDGLKQAFIDSWL